MLDIMMIQNCAPTVDPVTMSALIQVESSNHPYAIGVVGGRLIRQPVSHGEAVATARQLEKDGWNFSVGLGQVNRKYLSHHKISYDQAFKVCHNLHLSSKILKDCYLRAQKSHTQPQAALRAALSCYYAGNFWRGFKPEPLNKPSYVHKVVACAGKTAQAIPVVPAIQADSNSKSSHKDIQHLNTNEPIPPKLLKSPADHAPVLLPFSKAKNNTGIQLIPNIPKETEKVEQPQPSIVF